MAEWNVPMRPGPDHLAKQPRKSASRMGGTLELELKLELKLEFDFGILDWHRLGLSSRQL